MGIGGGKVGLRGLRGYKGYMGCMGLRFKVEGIESGGCRIGFRRPSWSLCSRSRPDRLSMDKVGFF